MQHVNSYSSLDWSSGPRLIITDSIRYCPRDEVWQGLVMESRRSLTPRDDDSWKALLQKLGWPQISVSIMARCLMKCNSTIPLAQMKCQRYGEVLGQHGKLRVTIWSGRRSFGDLWSRR